MTTKLETSYSGHFLENKINMVLSELNSSLLESKPGTKEDISGMFNDAFNRYKKNLNKAFFHYQNVAAGEVVDITKMNNDFEAIQKDLSLLYLNLKSIRDTLTSNFNALAGASVKIKSDIAEISSLLIDYQLQSKGKDQPTFSDSFLNLSKIELDDKSYTKTKAFIDTYNSNVVLGLDGEAETLKVRTVTITEDSIGIAGNNQEIGALARDNLQFLTDGNLDTWFEFEQVSPNELSSPTSLGLKIEFEEEKIFNLLDLVPVFFPSGTYPGILEIKGSLDGATFFDLMPLYLGDLSVDSYGQKVIQLGENSREPNAGSMLYFTPKKLKFLTLKITEDTSYFIKTTSGIKRRRAIGIRELNAKSQKYKNESQFITSNFSLANEISKIALFTEEFFPSGFDTTFNYYISVDNGQNWDAISPSQRIKADIPEVLNYNIDFLKNSKKTNFPVTSVKLKADIKIAENTSRLSLGSNYTEVHKTEFKNFVPGIKTIQLEQAPSGDVQIKQLGYGSVGDGSWYKIHTSNIQKLDDRTVVQLPLNVFPLNSINENQESIKINNVIWKRVNAILPTSLVGEYIYEFDYLNNTITFAKNFNAEKDSKDNLVFRGKAPGDAIYFKLDREPAVVENTGSKIRVKTAFGHSGVVEDIKFYRVAPEELTKKYTLRNKSAIHRTGIEEVVSITKVADPRNLLLNQKDFINGVVELVNPGDYSFDKGVIYTQRAVDHDEQIILDIKYKAREYVPFTIKDEQIETEIANYKNRAVKFNITTTVNSFVVDLGYRNIEPRSVVMTTTNAAMVTEVPFEKMEESFNDPTLTNQYCIDYKKGLIYFKNKTKGTFTGTLNLRDYFIEYNVAYSLPSSLYSIKKTERLVEFTDKFISDFFNSTVDLGFSLNLVKVSYNYLQEIKETNTELLAYTTPFLMSYKIATTPKGTII